MKKSIFLSVLAAAMLLIGCEEKGYIPAPGEYTTDETKPLSFTVSDTTGFGVKIPADAISAKEANAICRKLLSGEKSAQSYNIVGIVKSIESKYTDTKVASFRIVDFNNPYAIGSDNEFYIFKVSNIGGTEFESAGYGLTPGTAVVVNAQLTNYNGTLETQQGGQIIATNFKEVLPETVGDGSYTKPFTIADVIALHNKGQEFGYVRGYIVGTAKETGADATISADNIQLTAPFEMATNILLADAPTTADPAALVPMEVPSRRGAYGDICNAINLVVNPDNLGQQVLVYGSLRKFVNTSGVISVTYAEINGNAYGSKPE